MDHTNNDKPFRRLICYAPKKTSKSEMIRILIQHLQKPYFSNMLPFYYHIRSPRNNERDKLPPPRCIERNT